MSEANEMPKRRLGDNPPPVPEGMSKSQWKKKWRKMKFEETKEEYATKRREKRKRARDNRRAIIKGYEDRGEPIPEEYIRVPKINAKQDDSGINIILDCGFDEKMIDKEIVSLSNQVTRAYSANRRSNHYANIKVTSFNKRLEHRFTIGLEDSNHENWDHFKFVSDEKDITDCDKSKTIYLSADTEDTLETLEPGMTYIVGGIVDKNRHKSLCHDKAVSLGIPTKKLPLDEFIKIEGRRVLTTTHVVQLMLKYFDNHDWKEAFQSILPPRKLGIPSLSDLPASDDESESDHAPPSAALNASKP